MKSFQILVFLHLCQFCTAQLFEELKKLYPGENEVIISDRRVIDLSMSKGSPQILVNYQSEKMIMDEIGIQNDYEVIYYSSLVPLDDYEAYTKLPAFKKSKKILVTHETEASGKESYVFHDDVVKKKLYYHNLEPGASKLLDYKIRVMDPSLLPGMTFQRGSPATEIALEVSCDKNIELGYMVLNDFKNDIKFSKIESGSKIKYLWQRNNIKPIHFESQSLNYLYWAPQVQLYIKSYKKDGKIIPYLGTPELLHALYKKYIDQLNVIQDPELKAFTLKLIQGVETEEEKVKKIYYWVKSNIKYVAFEKGYEGFIPRQGKEVFQRKFGDCKDMASLITAMCTSAGIKNVNLAWIGTRELPYEYTKIPTPACDNHMIAVYTPTNSQSIFLDATDSQTKYGLPSFSIQGKETLVNQGSQFTILKVPIVNASENSIQRNVQLKIEGRNLTGNATCQMHGYSKSFFVKRIGDISGQNRNNYIKDAMELGHNKFILRNYLETGQDNLDQPYLIKYDFDIKDYTLDIAGETYINLHVDKPYIDDFIQNDREQALELDYLIRIENEIELYIPENKTIGSLLPQKSFDNEVMRCDFSYQKDGNKIILKYFMEPKKLILEKKDFQAWNTALGVLKKQYNELIVLKNKK